jgi:outer membrane receptor protein involved in Fe transport
MVEMNDYLRALPSINFIDRGPGSNNVIIRGIATQVARADDTVGIYIGDTPVSNLGVLRSGSPDLKLVDIARVEVLRGPQGTLYGEGSMGGTVRIIPAPPKPDRFEAQVTGSISATAGEGGTNNTVEGMVNLPLLDGDAALRLVAYRHDNSGYYRNIAGSDPETRYWAEVFGAQALDQDDIGATTYEGWRAQLLWQPSADLRVTLMALSQDIDESGVGLAEPGLGSFQQSQPSKRNGEGNSGVMDFDLTSLEVSYDTGPLSLLSTTSLVESWAGWVRHAGSFAPWFGFGDTIPTFNDWIGPHESRNQEFRITSRQDRRLRYLAGYFYQDIDSWVDNIITYHGDPAADPLAGVTYGDALGEFEQKQQALFGEVSFDLTDRLSASAGLRWYQYEQLELWTGYGWLGGVEEDDGYYDLSASEDDGQNFSLALNYEASDTTRVYGSFNQGFRLGGPHPVLPPGVCDVDGDGVIDGTDFLTPKLIASDEVDSYELGIKYRSNDGQVAFSAAIFSVDWTDIPVRVPVPCNFPLWLNAGEAESQGLEIEGQWEFADGWRLNYAASWLDAKLVNDAPGIGQAGERLPGSPKHNLNLGIERDFAIRGRDAFVRADLLNVGEYYGILERGTALGDYTTVDLRGGMGFGDLLVEAYVRNLTDEFALTSVTTCTFCSIFYSALRPRTVGMQISYRFGGQ